MPCRGGMKIRQCIVSRFYYVTQDGREAVIRYGKGGASSVFVVCRLVEAIVAVGEYPVHGYFSFRLRSVIINPNAAGKVHGRKAPFVIVDVEIMQLHLEGERLFILTGSDESRSRRIIHSQMDASLFAAKAGGECSRQDD